MSAITPAVGYRPPVRRSLPSGAAEPVRLTRRGRLVLTLAALVAAAGAALGTGGAPAVAGLLSVEGPVAHQQVTVRPGDTLWAIAERTAPAVDPRETVAELMDLNALTTSSVRAGQVLLLPSAG